MLMSMSIKKPDQCLIRIKFSKNSVMITGIGILCSHLKEQGRCVGIDLQDCCKVGEKGAKQWVKYVIILHFNKGVYV